MNFASFVLDKINQVVTDPYSIKEQNSTTLVSANLIQDADLLSLYSTDGYYDLVLTNPNWTAKSFRLFHLPISREKEAFDLFSKFAEKLLTLCQCSNQCFHPSILQNICTLIRTRSFWSPAHIAVEAGLKDKDVYSKRGPLGKWLNSQACELHYTPLHIACQLNEVDIVSTLAKEGVDLSKCDDKGNTVFHLCINVGSDRVFPVLCSAANSRVLNMENNDGETVLHMASRRNKFELCKLLIDSGADVFHKNSNGLPIHYALKYRALKSLEVLLEHDPNMVHLPCNKHGAIPLHWCKEKEEVNLLYKYNTPTEISSRQHHLPLHVMVLRGRLEAAVAVILGNARVNGKGKNGNTALHLAIVHDYVMLVKMLLLFGADHRVENDFGETPGMLAIRSTKPNKEAIVEMLSSIGGIVFKSTPVSETPLHRNSKGMLGDGYRVLSLDGGGIKGLILTQILMAIEKASGKKSKELFDWIAGTSTGAILALCLAQGKDAVDVQKLYFRLKDKVFVGSRPYSAEPMEEFLKHEFGEDTTMESISDGPKVIILTCLADRKPMQLHFFQNYDCPGKKSNPIRDGNISRRVSSSDLKKLKEKQPSLKQPLWKAARSSGAAPTYFRPMDKFVDGGIIANNPTLDALTEIHRYYKSVFKKVGTHNKPKEVSMVVSIGTGCGKTTVARSVDVYRPTNPVALVNSALAGWELTQMLIDVACESNGHVVERAKAWCEMMDSLYYRLNPTIDEEISLDEVDDTKLLNFMWETQVYLYENAPLIQEVANNLCKSEAT